MSLFSGMARQAAALPPIQQQAPPQRGRGLFGGGRQPDPNAIGLMERIAMAGQALGGEGTYQGLRRTREEEMRAQALAAQQRQATTQNEDRLRAELSPMDGPMGSGTGAAPSLEQQMAALDDARLRDPAVAERFAPVVQGRQAQDQSRALFGNDPMAAALWTSGNEEFRNSQAKQYAPMTAAEGTAIHTPGTGDTFFNEQRSVVGDRVVGMGTNTQAPRELLTVGPSYDDKTERGTSLRPEIVSTPAGGTTNVFNPDGSLNNSVQGNPANAVDPAIVARQAEARTAMAQNLRTGLTGARRYLDAAGVLAPYLPWEMQDRADLAAQLDTLKGNITFEKLTEMKANSPNGASGLGALSDNEARMLASTVAALDPSMSQQELARSFTVIDALVKKLEEAPAAPQGQPQGQARQPLTPEQARARLRSMGVAGY